MDMSNELINSHISNTHNMNDKSNIPKWKNDNMNVTNNTDYHINETFDTNSYDICI